MAGATLVVAPDDRRFANGRLCKVHEANPVASCMRHAGSHNAPPMACSFAHPAAQDQIVNEFPENRENIREFQKFCRRHVSFPILQLI